MFRSRRSTLLTARMPGERGAAVDARLDVERALAARLEDLLDRLADRQDDRPDERARVDEVEGEGVHVDRLGPSRSCSS